MALQSSSPPVRPETPPSAQPCSQDHESLAADLLQRKDFSAASVIRLIDLLPRESGLRKVQGRGGSRLCLGAYFRAGVVSLCKNNTSLKHSCKYLCAFIHHVAPRHVFAALDMLDEVQSGVHLDRFNVKRSSSLVVPITQFSGGELWVEDPAGHQPSKDGEVERFGYLHDFMQGPCLFDPHSRHAVMPWNGRRVVIAAYLPMGVDTADPHLESALKHKENQAIQKNEKCQVQQAQSHTATQQQKMASHLHADSEPASRTTLLARYVLCSSAPAIYEHFRNSYSFRELRVESCSREDIELYLEQSKALTPKQIKKTKYKFMGEAGVRIAKFRVCDQLVNIPILQDGSVRVYSLDSSVNVFYRLDKNGLMTIMRNTMYAADVQVKFPAEDDLERFHEVYRENQTGHHRPRRHDVKVPTAPGQPVRG